MIYLASECLPLFETILYNDISGFTHYYDVNADIVFSFAIFFAGFNWKCWAGYIKQGTGKHLNLWYSLFLFIYTFLCFLFCLFIL